MLSWECHRCGVVNAPTRIQCTCRPREVLVAGSVESTAEPVPATVAGAAPPVPKGRERLPSESWVEIMPTVIRGAEDR